MTKVEIIVSTFEDAEIAEDAGADGVEMCIGYALGGLTPNFAEVQQALERTNLRVSVLIRPYEGSFEITSEAEEQAHWDQLEIFTKIPASDRYELRIGATDTQKLDFQFIQDVKHKYPDYQIGVHRCFDVAQDMWESIDMLSELKVSSVLTSGGKPTAWEGRENLKRLVQVSKVPIFAASKIRAENVAQLVRETGVPWVHASAWQTLEVENFRAESPTVDFGVRPKVSYHAVSELVYYAKSNLPPLSA